MNKKILLGHGSGGKLTHDLIKDLFIKNFTNPILDRQTDSAIIKLENGNIAFTTDSFVVDPIFFPGGNIGKLAVCGTVNDLAVSGAIPAYMTASFILEEGLLFTELEEIVLSMAEEAEKAGIKITSGDTKVVNKGKCDKIFINTSGIGLLSDKTKNISFGQGIKPGDKIIINGAIGDHGIAILSARESLNFSSDIKSDCACLNYLIQKVLSVTGNVKFMRDPTRGGVATVLNELVEKTKIGIKIFESEIFVRDEVRGACEIFGYDPLYIANEGKVIIVVDKNDSEKVLKTMRKDKLGLESSIIGEITQAHSGKVIMETIIGGSRVVDMITGEQLPRIC